MMANLFDRWWSNFIQWSIIIVPLLLSLWIAGFFLQAQTGCPKAAPTPAEVTNTFDNVEICKATTQVLALGVLIMGIMASLSFSAAGSRAIIQGTSRQYKRAVGASSRWAEKQAYLRGPGVGKFVAEKVPGAARVGRIGASIGKAVGEVPGVKRLVAPAIRRGVSVREEALGEWKKIKDYDKFSPTALRQSLNFEVDGKRRAKILDLLATKNPGELNKHVDGLIEEDMEKGTEKYEKLIKEMNARAITMPGSEKSILQIRPDIAKEMGRNMGEIIAQATTKTIQNWSPKTLGDTRVAQELIKQNKFNKETLKEIAKDPNKFDSFKGALEKIYATTDEKQLFKAFKEQNEESARAISESPHISALWKAAGQKSVKEQIKELIDEEGGVSSDEGKKE